MVRESETRIFVGFVVASNVPRKFPQYISASVFFGSIAELSALNSDSSVFEVVSGFPCAWDGLTQPPRQDSG